MEEHDKLIKDYLFMKEILKGAMHMNDNGFDEVHIMCTPELKDKLTKILNRDDSEDSNEFYDNNIHYVATRVYFDLCSKFVEPCREHPTTPWNEIPEAVKAMDESRKFIEVCKNYFGIDFSGKDK